METGTVKETTTQPSSEIFFLNNNNDDGKHRLAICLHFLSIYFIELDKDIFKNTHSHPETISVGYYG